MLEGFAELAFERVEVGEFWAFFSVGEFEDGEEAGYSSLEEVLLTDGLIVKPFGEDASPVSDKTLCEVGGVPSMEIGPFYCFF